jgi:YD repeat-containing protein
VNSVVDAASNQTKNVFGPFSQLRRVHLPDGTFRETTADDYGRVILVNDPDRGKTLLEYNGFDELTHLHDALDRHFVFEHDKLGRLIKRAQGIDVSTMEYDTAAHGIGFPARNVGADGHAEEYEYDSLSRPIKTTLRLADGRDFAQSQSYDPFGRPLRSTYPNGLS